MTFILESNEEDQTFEVEKSAILQDNGYDQELCDLLHSLLKWPKAFVRIIGVSVNDGEGNDYTIVNTLDELRKFMDYENSVFQLHAIGSTQAAVPKPASASHRDYRTHSIFKLEDIAAQLSCDSRDEAEHLFALVRRNHKCSGVFIQDLMDLFAPLRDRVDREWEQVEDLMTLCEKGVNMDAQTALGFRDWVGHLSDPTQQTHARIYLDLIGTNSPLMSHGIGELIKLFRPNNGIWEDLCGMKEIFRTIDLDAAYD